MDVGGHHHDLPARSRQHRPRPGPINEATTGSARRQHDRLCIEFYAAYGHLEDSDPEAFLAAFIEFQVHAAAFVRPALHAALDLGADTVWPTLERAMSLGLEDWVRIARRVVPDADERDLVALCRAVRRTMLGAMLDKTITPAELRQELRALIVGEPVGLRREFARTA